MSARNASAAASPRTRKPLDIDRTPERLDGLGLGFAADALERTLTESVRDGITPQDFLDALLRAELEARETRRVGTALRLSNLQPGLMLAEFDCGFRQSVDCSNMDTLATGAWIKQNQTLLIQGPPDVGYPQGFSA